MKLLFITRKVDRGDPLTGFIFGWLREFAANVETLQVICLEKGNTSGLPENVRVFSMGKEKGSSRLQEFWIFWRLLFRFVPATDGIFIHMHPVYGIVAWLPAKLFRKKMILWYTHKSVDLKLRFVHMLVQEVVTASPESFRLPSKKVKIVGHGIDLEKFRLPPPEVRPKNAKFQILSIGRISPVKDYETLVKAIEILVNHQGIKDLEVKIYGTVGLPEHQTYLDSLAEFVRQAELEQYVKFEGELNYEYVDEAYAEADLFVNLSQTGSIDKTVLEAAASGILVLTSNEAFVRPFLKISSSLLFQRDQPAILAAKILAIKNLPNAGRQILAQKLRQWVEAEHNLRNLVKRVIQEFIS